MANVSLNIDRAAVARMLNSPSGEVGRYISKLGDETVRIARRRAPEAHSGSKRGELRRAIGITTWPGPRLLLQVTANTKFALAVHEGSRPHKIQGKPFLRFPSRRAGGKMIVVRSVNHPGHPRGNPFLMDALREAMRRSL